MRRNLVQSATDLPHPRVHSRPIPVVDLFAGPGGLSEGFASLRVPSGESCFDVRLSIEKDAAAHRTLELRSFVRAFGTNPPDAYYDFLSGNIEEQVLLTDPRFRDHAALAKSEAWHWTLSEETHLEASRRVKEAIGSATHWVLIGGPPCQAYSLAGRGRMRPVDPRRFERDERHFLYREYLRILADHAPPVFVMENVRGILSSTVRGRLIFSQILDDLTRPNGGSLRYRVVPFCRTDDLFESSPEDYLIRSEDFGIPQARHRVILCGIREDLTGRPQHLIPADRAPAIEDAISDLLPIRSHITREHDSHSAWLAILRDAYRRLDRQAGGAFADVSGVMRASMRRARGIAATGGSYTAYAPVRGRPKICAQQLRRWYRDPNLDGVSGHESRAHMRSDLQRYFFAAAYAEARGNVSPKLRHFPTFLLPQHRSAHGRSGQIPFDDRFRVQVYGEPSMTILAHIAKDGHYFIHPDPAQCRSLTLREAARLQTFPDNYHFLGNRTEGLEQVGNAVPPLLARQIASVLWNFITGRMPASRAAQASVEPLRASAAI